MTFDYSLYDQQHQVALLRVGTLLAAEQSLPGLSVCQKLTKIRRQL